VTSGPLLRGGCGCGAVRFEITAPLLDAVYCHCTRCQKRTGTGFQASAKVAPNSVTISAGAEHLREWTPGGLAKAFCGSCGSHLFARVAGDGEVRAVRMAAIDGDPVVRPSAHQFVAYASNWERLPQDGLPRFQERMPGW
jgi:hypothetical protein